MKSNHPMGDLESEIYSTEAHLELLTQYLQQQFGGQGEATERICAGIQNLTCNRQKSLRQAFYAVHDEWRNLKGHNK